MDMFPALRKLSSCCDSGIPSFLCVKSSKFLPLDDLSVQQEKKTGGKRAMVMLHPLVVT